MVAAFPIMKLGALALKQLAKPLSNRIKQRAKTSTFFKNYVCMPPAQAYHWLEINIKMRMLNVGKPEIVRKLHEQTAIELGAELLGETIIFMVATLTITLEYMRQSRNERLKEIAKESITLELTQGYYDLVARVEKNEDKINEIKKFIKEKDLGFPKEGKIDANKNKLEQILDDAVKVVIG